MKEYVACSSSEFSYIRRLAFPFYLKLDIYLLRFYCKAAKFTLNYFHTSVQLAIGRPLLKGVNLTNV